MIFDDVAAALHGIKHTPREKGKILYDTILERGYRDCLELGFAHGVGSCYMAAALNAQGFGTLVSVDTEGAMQRKPRADHTAERLGLKQHIEFVFHPISYTWFLKEAIRTGRQFDFCFLDGAHTWDVDGFAFLLVERILKPGGMIIFDDLDWSIAHSPTMRNLDFHPMIKQHRGVRDTYELLVKNTPGLKTYEKDGWAYAEKA